MASFYSVIRYIPDPIADESINIGVVVVDEGNVKLRFIDNWNRAHIFGKENVSFLREFAKEMTTKQLNIFSQVGLIDESRIKEMLGRWKNSIQFTNVRASIKSGEELLKDITEIFLRGSILKESKKVEDKRYALKFTSNKVCSLLERRFGKEAKSCLKKTYPLKGRLEQHEVDLVVANGKPYFGAFTLSFMIRDSVALRKEVDAAAFAVEDVKRTDKKFPLALIALPPTGKSESYLRAKKIFEGLNTPIIKQKEIDNWAKEMVNNLPNNLI